MGNDIAQSVPLWLLLTAAGICIILSMIFSAAESAFLSINKLRVRSLRNKKDKRATRVWNLLSNKERLINTLLVGNNIVNVIISSIIAYLALQWFGNAGIGIATFAATMLLLIFGAKVNTKEKSLTFTEEEIKTFIEVSGEQGIIDKNKKNMMRRVFKFSDLAAKDIMTPRKNIRAIHADASYKEVIEFSERHLISRFPVYRNSIDDIIGILYMKDLLFYNMDDSGFSVRNIMRPPLFILGTKKMSGIQQMLEENHQSMAVVIDEYSGTDGILTTEDIAREIFGPIADEYKPYARRVEVVIKNENSGKIEGQSRLVDLNEHLGIHLQSDYCETIGGYMAEKLGRIPEEGDCISAEGYNFSVLKMDDKRVAKIRLTKKTEAEE